MNSIFCRIKKTPSHPPGEWLFWNRWAVITILLLNSLFVCPGGEIFGQVVDNEFGKAFMQIFPELSKGYIDLNENGKVDQTEDFDEIVPESRVKDNLLQVQEILDYIADYYRFIPQDKLLAVRKNLEDASGTIPEIIALSYSASVDDIITRKKELGGEGIFLTPSALQEAMERMEGFIATMAFAYKKEGGSSETDFIKARNELLKMIERGYPLPENLNKDDTNILVRSMINSVVKEKNSDLSKVKAAIHTLGKLKSPEAVPYLMELINLEEIKADSIQALGEIGTKDALNLLTEELSKTRNAQVKTTIIQALGKIGGSDSLNRILGLFAQNTEEKLTAQTEKAALSALAMIVSKGSHDNKIFNIFSNYISSDNAELRIMACQGLAFYKTPQSGTLLLDLLKNEKDEKVKTWIIRSLNQINQPATIPTFINLLRTPNVSDTTRLEIIKSLGSNNEGVKALVYLTENLMSPNNDIRSAASKALINLFSVDPAAVTAAISKALLSTNDELLLSEGTSILAQLADPASVNTLYALLQKPYPEVKKNVTWALYRIRPANNPRIVDELNKLVTSETEPLSVRINSVRALGAIGYDAPNLRIWQTLLTIAKLRGEKYGMFRFFAIRAIGDLGVINEEVTDTLGTIATRERDVELKKEAVKSARKLGIMDRKMEQTLTSLFKKEKDVDLRVLVLEALGDMGSTDTSSLSPSLLDSSLDAFVKQRIIYALSRVGREDDLSVILDAAKDTSLQTFVIGVLENANPIVMKDLITRRMKTENNESVLAVLETLQAGIESRF
ncbi:MAG: HEAT repeat domain-containing protein [Spirochaetota bacterium]